MINRTQEDTVADYSENFFRSNTHNTFLAVATKEEFVKFFSTVLRLQMVITDDQIHYINKYFDKSDICPNVAAKYFMGLYDEAIYEGEKRLLEQGFQTFSDLCVKIHVFFAYRAKGDISGSADFIKCLNQAYVSKQLIHQPPSPNASNIFYIKLMTDLVEKQMEVENQKYSASD